MIERIAYYLDRSDEEPNVQLAEEIAKTGNRKGFEEIIAALRDENAAVANDCIKVAYEVGYRNPSLLEPYAKEFLDALTKGNNRLTWGSCIALSLIAEKKSDEIFKKVDLLEKTYEKGSVITEDNCVSVFALLIKGNPEHEGRLLPLLMEHIAKCRPKDVPQRAERIRACITPKNAPRFIEILTLRMGELSKAQAQRVQRVITSIERMP